MAAAHIQHTISRVELPGLVFVSSDTKTKMETV